MFNLLRKRKPAAPTPQVRIIRRDPCRLRVSEWRSDPGLVKVASKALADPVLRQMLDVVEHELFATIGLLEDLTMEGRAIQQARIEGYVSFLRALESLSVSDAPKQYIRPTWEEEEIEPPNPENAATLP